MGSPSLIIMISCHFSGEDESRDKNLTVLQTLGHKLENLRHPNMNLKYDKKDGVK